MEVLPETGVYCESSLMNLAEHFEMDITAHGTWTSQNTKCSALYFSGKKVSTIINKLKNCGYNYIIFIITARCF